MIRICSIAFIIFTSGIQISIQDDTWSYTGEYGPNQWNGACQIGNQQSPIDIETDKTIRDDLGSLKFTKYDFAYSGTLTNNGHTVQIQLSGVPLILTGGGLESTYIFEQMHFHWPAEHTIDGRRDPLELHLVHFNKRFANVSEALAYRDGIVVVAVLFKFSDEDNTDLEAVVRAADWVSHWVGQSSTTEIQGKVIPQLLLPKDRTSFYKYEGSLTTPGCEENVTWFIFTEKLAVSREQIRIFRNVTGPDGPLDTNFRPLQKLNNRKIYHHLLGYTSDSIQIDLPLEISMMSDKLPDITRRLSGQPPRRHLLPLYN